MLVLILTLFQCADPCKEVECNNGSCLEGVCECDEGYEGEFCDGRKSERFTGQWEGLFDCVDISENATVNIEDHETDIRRITLNTVGLEMGYDGFSFTLDNTLLNGMINQSFTGLVIDTQSMTIEIPNNPGISADVFGSATLVDENTLDLLIKVKNDDFGVTFSCSGMVDRK
jgi:hypothetical protein